MTVGRLPDREKTAPGQREIVLINKESLALGALLRGAVAKLRSRSCVLQTSMLLAFSRQIAASALKKRLSTIYGYRNMS
jgi:hypothetical protein